MTKSGTSDVESSFGCLEEFWVFLGSMYSVGVPSYRRKRLLKYEIHVLSRV